jgi:hypothetical protein
MARLIARPDDFPHTPDLRAARNRVTLGACAQALE